MKIYTKTGDNGTTSLFDGRRVKKYDLRVETYGTFDELSAHIGLCRKFVSCELNKEWLEKIQKQLVYLCAELATDHPEKSDHLIRLTEADINQLEDQIDEWMARLPKVTTFTLPREGASSSLHVARTITRRAERLLVKLDEEIILRSEVKGYVNRLSDFFYTMAREEDFREEVIRVAKQVMASQSKERLQHKEDSFSSFSIAYFSALAKAVETAAKKEGLSVSLSVVNLAGHHLFHYRMEDALLASICLARKKAYTAIAMKMPTHELAELVLPGAPLYQLETSMNGDLVTFGGGLPILNEAGHMVGGIGISGATVCQDIAIAKEALSNVKMR